MALNPILSIEQIHFAPINYAIFPNTLDTQGLSQNVEKAISIAHDQTLIETRTLTPFIESQDPRYMYKILYGPYHWTTDKFMLTIFL